MESVMNIWSKSDDELCASLTNPTELAVYHGKLKANQEVPAGVIWMANTKTKKVMQRTYKQNPFFAYPIQDKNGEWYGDLEAAYFRFRGEDEENNYKVMTKLLIAKLNRYPNLIDSIRERGGVSWLETCEHTVYGHSPAWEGKGMESGFIRCLVQAYESCL